MPQNAFLLAVVVVDTAENELSKDSQNRESRLGVAGVILSVRRVASILCAPFVDFISASRRIAHFSLCVI